MMLNDNYAKLFGKIPIFGMIHLSGHNKVQRALDELAIFEEEGVDGAIVENYHGNFNDITNTLKEVNKKRFNLVIGVNVLPNEYFFSMPLAEDYGAQFVQLDHVSGVYREGELNEKLYSQFKNKYPEIMVLGGVWPKYYHPVGGSNLESDLKVGMQRAEAIVVTGAGTGEETPLDKIMKFRELIGDHPLVIGAGLTPENAYEQLCISNGGIVGSSLKINNNTNNPIDKYKVRDFMSAVKEARTYQDNISS